MWKRKEEAAGLTWGSEPILSAIKVIHIYYYPASHVRRRIQYAREVDGEAPILVLGSSSV